MIYAIKAGKTGKVKIGKTNNLARRLNSLRTGSPHKLRVLATADWPDEMEGHIHSILSESRGHGEWFEMGEYLRGIIELMKEGKDAHLKLFQLAPEDRRPPKKLQHLFTVTPEDLRIPNAR